MPRILPELEAYQHNLEERCRAWGESGEEALQADLARCRAQVALVEKRLKEFDLALEAMPRGLGEERERAEKRRAVQAQMRDLTAAYARVLELHIEKRENPAIRPNTDSGGPT